MTATQRIFNGRRDFIKLYQKTGETNFNELQVTDSTLNEGTNSLVNELIGVGKVVCRVLSHNERHKTRND